MEFSVRVALEFSVRETRGHGLVLLAYQVDDSVDFDGFPVLVPPLGLTDVTRVEYDLGAVWQGHVNLNDGRLSTCRASQPFC